MPLAITPIVSGGRTRPESNHVSKLIHDGVNAVRAFEQIETEHNNLERRVRGLETLVQDLTRQLTEVRGSLIYIITQTLTENYTVPVPGSIPPGSLVIYVFIQDSTGGWTVTFPDPPFLILLTEAGGEATGVSATANSVSTMAMYVQDPNTIRQALAGYSGVV